MEGANYLRDSLMAAAKGPLDICTFRGAIINRPTREPTTHSRPPPGTGTSTRPGKHLAVGQFDSAAT